MPILDNARHEKFAQELARGNSAISAYGNAGYKPDDGHASRLAGNGKIDKRLKELQQGAAKRVELDRADILRMLIDDREMARERGQASASIKATELLGRELCGMFIDRKEIVTENPFRNLPTAELYEQFAQMFESLDDNEMAAAVRKWARS